MSRGPDQILQRAGCALRGGGCPHMHQKESSFTRSVTNKCVGGNFIYRLAAEYTECNERFDRYDGAVFDYVSFELEALGSILATRELTEHVTLAESHHTFRAPKCMLSRWLSSHYSPRLSAQRALSQHGEFGI
ncbi:hypothetical protein EVAR_65978_1 [Eumeta japonica]|uniref:Uncharacterized protein n=1 Tax=Eumeta variegata TaxID=151549 RepID=A0A4C2A0S0_EUMVA|nr:hypothetical protein EVAR_65978_1 [Eumeta japonica]